MSDKSIFGLDPTCGNDANLQHLIHWVEGYRAVILNEHLDGSPCSPESARDVSWRQGVAQAIADKKSRYERVR